MCILVVEDEPLIRMIVVEELLDAGFRVWQAASGDTALPYIIAPPAPILLLITDIHMPGRLNGIEIATILRDRHPEVPIVYTTGRPDVVERLGWLRAQDALLSKPFIPSKLMTIVRQLLHSAS